MQVAIPNHRTVWSSMELITQNMAISPRLRPATNADMQQLLTWRNNAWIVSLSSSQRLVTWEEHVSWFERILTDEQHLLFIIESQIGREAGTVRLDRADTQLALITIYLLREFTARGIGVKALIKACAQGFACWPIERIHAYIRADNYPSKSAFTKAGFVLVTSGHDCPTDHVEMALHRTP